ncbi:hypothetical protein [Spongorhabdus nitratireducens]
MFFLNNRKKDINKKHKKAPSLPLTDFINILLSLCIILISFNIHQNAFSAPTTAYYKFKVSCQHKSIYRLICGCPFREYVYADGIVRVDTTQKSSSQSAYNVMTLLENRHRDDLEYFPAGLNQPYLRYLRKAPDGSGSIISERYDPDSDGTTRIALNWGDGIGRNMEERTESAVYILDFMLQHSIRRGVVFDPYISAGKPVEVIRKEPKSWNITIEGYEGEFNAACYKITPTLKSLRKLFYWRYFIVDMNGSKVHMVHELILLDHPVKITWYAMSDSEYYERQDQGKLISAPILRRPMRSILQTERNML